MKVIMGKGQSKRTLPKGNKGPQVSGFNQCGPSENTRSQIKDRRKYATQAAVTSYEKVAVDVVTSDTDSKSIEEDVNQISNDEVSDVTEEQLSMDENSNDEQ